jgi:hypothetical protein
VAEGHWKPDPHRVPGGFLIQRLAAFHDRARPFIDAALYPAVILLLNILIVAKMFRVEYSAYLESNEGTFIAIARKVAHFSDLRWWPLWDCGMPFQNTYLPLLHLITGTFSRLSGHSPALAFHQVSAAFFAVGPVCLYFMALGMTRQPGTSFFAALAYSLLSPSAWMFPAIRDDLGGAWNLRRLQVLAYYGEGPTTASLAFLGLAILFLYLAVVERRLWQKVVAGLWIAATVLANAFGAVILILAGISLLATIDTKRFWRNAGLFLVIGTLAYAFVSPLLPPSVITAIRTNSPTVGSDDYHFTMLSLIGVEALTAGFFILWWIGRRARSPVFGFFLLFAFLTAGIVWLAYDARIFVLPQPERYSTVMNIPLCLLMVFGVAMFLRNRAPKAAPMIAVICVLAAVPLFRHDRRYARRVIQAIDITATPPYRIARWMDEHMQGQRVMISGNYSFYFNDFTDTPQLHGGHDPMEPNPVTPIAIFAIYSGMNMGSRDGELSVLWLKALGAHAISVAGPQSSEHDKPFRNPRKFEGLLPVVWREGDDTIYTIPARSDSLAHVVPAEAVVRDQPINGLDTGELERYVKAIEDPSLPEAGFVWRNDHTATIEARLEPHQVISVQETFNPGWRATIHGVPQSVKKDGLGLLVIEPACQGECEISLTYDGGQEWRATCLASLLALAAVPGCFVYNWWRRTGRTAGFFARN